MSLLLSMGYFWAALCALYVAFSISKYKEKLLILARPICGGLFILAILVTLSAINKVVHEERTWDLYLLILSWNVIVWLMFGMYGFKCGKKLR